MDRTRDQFLTDSRLAEEEYGQVGFGHLLHAMEYVAQRIAIADDLIELGMPFSDPMADGPAIQAANQRALAAGASDSARACSQ